MKLMIASDIHGSLYYCEKVREILAKETPANLLLLGDLLYPGPRNDRPRDYTPKGVIRVLNAMKQELLCVRGNCDAEVDQMVLEFPIMADYMILYLQGHMIFVTHGHVHNKEHLPMLKKGAVRLHGHTHVQAMEDLGDYWYLNPGSVSLPKEGNANSYMIYEDGKFLIKDLDGNVLKSCQLI